MFTTLVELVRTKNVCVEILVTSCFPFLVEVAEGGLLYLVVYYLLAPPAGHVPELFSYYLKYEF